eukprot:214272_1
MAFEPETIRTIDIEKDNHLWPKRLIVNQELGEAFSCVKCKGVPKTAMADPDWNVLCSECAKNIDDTHANEAVQNMIGNLKTKCLSLLHTSHNVVEGTNLLNTIQCDQYKIKDYHIHEQECPFAIIRCDKCEQFTCQRRLLNEHLNKCGDVTINCSLCDAPILRKNELNHLDDDDGCQEKRLDCTNDGCDLQIQRKSFYDHVNHNCEERIVLCDYAHYGCEVNQIKAKQLKNHLDQSKFEHLEIKFEFITEQQNEKIEELEHLLELNDDHFGHGMRGRYGMRGRHGMREFDTSMAEQMTAELGNHLEDIKKKTKLHSDKLLIIESALKSANMISYYHPGKLKRYHRSKTSSMHRYEPKEKWYHP